MSSINLFKHLRLDEILPDEFFEICISHIDPSYKFIKLENKETEIRFQKNNIHLFSIVINKDGKIICSNEGENLKLEDLNDLKNEIELVLDESCYKIIREILFSEISLRSAIKCQPYFQLCPPSSDFTIHEQAVGKHPIIIEVAYKGTKSEVINRYRANKAIQKYMLLSNLLLNSKFYKIGTHERHWVMVGEVGEEKYQYCYEGYVIKDFDCNANEFSQTNNIANCFDINNGSKEDVFRKHYFFQDLFSPLMQPCNFKELIEKFYKLNGISQDCFLQALNWFYLVNYQNNTSISMICLANTIHAASKLIAKCKACNENIGDHKKFVKFLNDFGITKEHSEEFYKDYRCHLAHGGILKSDIAIGLNISFNPYSWNESSKVHGFRYLIRLALINWLSRS